MQLSICMMIKNEEKHLENCLKSLEKIQKSIESELIIVDTGSTDNSIEIAKKFTDKVFFHEWNNNFSEMRNISISYAKGEWILIIDGDEVFDKTDGIIEFLKGNIDKSIGAVAIEVINLTTDEKSNFVVLQSPRLFRNDKYFCYEGSIHNSCKYKGSCIGLTDRLIHYGYISTDKELMERKFKRTSELLIKELEKDPTNIYYLYQLSVTYSMHEENDKALVEIEKAYYHLKKSKYERSSMIFIYTQLIQCQYRSEKYEEAEKMCIEGIKYQNDYMDLYFFLAQIQAILGKYDQAIDNFGKYLKLVQNYENLSIRKNTNVNIFTLSNTNEALYNIAVMLHKREEYAKVLDYIEKMDAANFPYDEYKIYIDAATKIKRYNEIKLYYDVKVKNQDGGTKNEFFLTLESKIKEAQFDEKKQVYKLFAEEQAYYGNLNQIRMMYYGNNEDIKIKISEFISCTNLNVLDNYYSDILYFVIKSKIYDSKLFDNMNANTISNFFYYIFDSYNDFNLDLYEYIFGYKTIDYNDIRTRVLLERVLIINDKNLNENNEQFFTIFVNYINDGIEYMKNVYQPVIINEERIHDVKNEEQQFFIYMFHALQNRLNDQSNYVKYLRKALNAYPYMKNGIKLLLEEMEEQTNNDTDEFQEYMRKVKRTIKELIEIKDFVNAESLIKEYKDIVKNDVEIMLLESELMIGMTDNSHKPPTLKM